MATEQIQHLSLELVIAKPQVRTTFDEELLEGMIASLKEVGQLQPIRLRADGKQFVIVDGERRYRAILRLGWPTIAAIVELKGLSEAEIVQRQLIANCQREDLTASEKGAAISRLMVATGWNASQVAAKLGMSSAMATRFLALLSLPNDIRQLVIDGKIAPSSAYELTRIGDAKEQAELALKLASGALTRDGLVGMVKNGHRKPAGKPANGTNRVTAILGTGRSVTVVGKAIDLESFIASLEDVLARARKARPLGVGIETFIAMLKDQSQSV